MAAGVVAGIIGSPLAGLILDHSNGWLGLAGWKWLYFLEGIPAIVLGFVTLFYLTDRPELAHWLKPAERDWLLAELAAEHQQTGAGHQKDLIKALTSPRVWLLICVYFTVALGDNAYGFYAPTFLKEKFPDWSQSQLGFLLMVPGLIAIPAMVVIGRHSDRTGERRWHVAGSAFLAAAGWLAMSQITNPWLFFTVMVIALAGMKSMLPTFWAIPSLFLSGSAAAGGIALINSVANIGGFLSPTITGTVKDLTKDFTNVYLMLAGALACGGLLVLRARTDRKVD
jgi:ACS family tartrate transporter-like MFS transporter